MNVRTFLKPDAQTTKLMQPRNGAFDDPASFAQATAMRLAPFCDHRGDGSVA